MTTQVIVTSTGSSTLGMDGETTRVERVGMNVGMGVHGKSGESEFFSVINIFARSVGENGSLPARRPSTISSLRRTVEQMTMTTWNRCAGHAIERRPERSVSDELVSYSCRWVPAIMIIEDSNMLDLPTPQTLEACAEHARRYAEHLLSLPMIKAVAWLRLNIKPDNHPRWFILWLDDQIARIKFRIEGLSNWTGCNPEHAAWIVHNMIN